MMKFIREFGEKRKFGLEVKSFGGVVITFISRLGVFISRLAS